MANTRLIANNIKVELGKETGICKMCGQHTEKGFKAKDVIKDARFTNFDELKNIKSDVVCEHCTACMKNAQLRRSSYIADENKIIFLKKNDIENYIFDLDKIVKGSFVVCVTDSFKKHTSFKATVNNDTKKFVVTHENYKFWFDVKQLKEIYQTMNDMYLHFTKDEILSGEYEPYLMMEYFKEHTEDEFFSNESILVKERGSNAFKFLVHIMNSERKNEFVKEQRANAKRNRKKSD